MWSYASVVLSDSKVMFLGERNHATFHSFLYFVLFIVREVCHQILLSSKLQCVFLLRPATYLFLIGSNTAASTSFVSCPSLMSSWPIMIFRIGLSVIWRRFPRRFLKCSFHFRRLSSWQEAFRFALDVLFFLITSFTVCHAIYNCLSCTEFLIFINLTLNVF